MSNFKFSGYLNLVTVAQKFYVDGEVQIAKDVKTCIFM